MARPPGRRRARARGRAGPFRRPHHRPAGRLHPARVHLGGQLRLQRGRPRRLRVCQRPPDRRGERALDNELAARCSSTSTSTGHFAVQGRLRLARLAARPRSAWTSASSRPLRPGPAAVGGAARAAAAVRRPRPRLRPRPGLRVRGQVDPGGAASLQAMVANGEGGFRQRRNLDDSSLAGPRRGQSAGGHAGKRSRPRRSPLRAAVGANIGYTPSSSSALGLDDVGARRPASAATPASTGRACLPQRAISAAAAPTTRAPGSAATASTGRSATCCRGRSAACR